jgi:hypothetical protein
MATDDLRERLERFRIEYRESVETSDALVARTVPGGDAERWVRSCPPKILAAARREQEALLRELRSETPRPRTPRPTARPERAARLTPDDFAFRTMAR